METVNTLLFLAFLWLLMFATITACTFLINAYRKKGLPSLDPVWVIVGSALILCYAYLQRESVGMFGFLLFASGLASFLGFFFSLHEMKKAGNETVGDKAS